MVKPSADGVIYLGGSKKQSFGSRLLDVISAPLSQPKTTFTKGLSAGASAVEQSRRDIRTGKKSGVGTIVTTLATTAAAGGAILAAAPAAATGAAGAAVRSAATKIITSKSFVKTTGGIAAVAVLAPKTFKTFISTPGAASTAAAAAINPAAGLVVGLEKGAGLVSAGLKNFFGDSSVQQIGKIGAGVAGIGAAGALGVAAAKKLLPDKIPDITSQLPNLPKELTLPSVASFSSAAPGSIQTSSSEPLIKEEKREEKPATAAPNIKITNKPKINIAIAH